MKAHFYITENYWDGTAEINSISSITGSHAKTNPTKIEFVQYTSNHFYWHIGIGNIWGSSSPIITAPIPAGIPANQPKIGKKGIAKLTVIPFAPHIAQLNVPSGMRKTKIYRLVSGICKLGIKIWPAETANVQAACEFKNGKDVKCTKS